MPPHSSNMLNPENIETSSFVNINSSNRTNVAETSTRETKIIVIHGRKYDISNFKHPGRLNFSYNENYEC